MNPEESLLHEIVSIPSLTGEEIRVGKHIESWAEDHGLDVCIDDAGNVIVSAGQGEKEVVLLGHMDTVPGDIPVRVEGRTLHGRGSVDAKGSLATFLSALLRVKDRINEKGERRIVVVGAVEEEGSSKGAHHLCKEGINPDMIIIGEPSGHDAVTLGYKGSLRILFTADGEVSHGASKDIGPLDRGMRFYSRVFSWVQAFNEGKKRLEMLELRTHKMDVEQSDFLEKIVLDLRFRIPLGFSTKVLKEELASNVDGGVLEILGEEAPYQGEKRSQLVSAFMRAIRAEGLKPRLKSKTGTSDMNVVGPHFGVPILAYGPGDSSLDHTPQEYIDLDEYSKAIDVLERVLLDL